jgi:DNA-binding transcriptional LysR family regulator
MNVGEWWRNDSICDTKSIDWNDHDRSRYMLDLNDVYYFVQVVEKQGISAAAKSLDLPKSSVSRRILALEGALAVRLIQRTSRSFVVTEVGREFHRHAVAMLESAKAAEDVIRQRVAEPSGVIRFTCPVAFAQLVMANLIPAFMARFPRVRIVEHATNRYVDPINDGFDLCLRAHTVPLHESTLIIRRLAETPWHLFAGPAYLARKGVPETPTELADHDGVLLNGAIESPCWVLQHERTLQTISVPFSPRLQSDDMETLKAAACAGLGIVALPGYVGLPEAKRGQLARVLPQWTAGVAIISLLMPSSRGMLPSIRAFVDFMASQVPSAVTLHEP